MQPSKYQRLHRVTILANLVYLVCEVYICNVTQEVLLIDSICGMVILACCVFCSRSVPSKLAVIWVEYKWGTRIVLILDVVAVVAADFNFSVAYSYL